MVRNQTFTLKIILGERNHLRPREFQQSSCVIKPDMVLKSSIKWVPGEAEVAHKLYTKINTSSMVPFT